MFGFGLISVLRDRQVSNVPFLIVLLLLAVFAYRFMKKLVFNLADEVLDAGNALVVRCGGQEERIALSDIKNVNYSPYMSPPQVTLSVRRHTVFGETIAFLAPVRASGRFSGVLAYNRKLGKPKMAKLVLLAGLLVLIAKP